MNLQSLVKTRERFAKKLNEAPDNVDAYCWPETFGTTGGPSGIGGNSFTKYTVWAYVGVEKALLICENVEKIIDSKDFEQGMRIDWRKA